MMKHLLLGWLLLLPALLWAQDKWSLNRCIEHALENNIEIKQQDLSTALSEDRLQQSKFAFLPSLNSEASHAFNWGRSVDPTTYGFVDQNIQTTSLSLSTNLTLFNGFRKINTLKQAQYNQQAAEADAEQTRNNVILSITSAYLQILLSLEELNKAEKQQALSETQVDNTEKLVAAGMVPEGNLLEIKAQLARDKMAVTIADNQLDLAHLNLLNLLNLDPARDFEIDIPVLDIPDEAELEQRDPAAIYQTALTTQPVVKSSEFQLKSAEKTLSLARGSHYPVLSAFGALRSTYSSLSRKLIGAETVIVPIGATASLDTVYSQTTIPSFAETPYLEQVDNNFNQTVGLSLSIPIFNQWQTQTAVNQAKVSLMQLKLSDQLIRQNLRTEVYRAYTDAKAAAKRYAAAHESLEAQEKAFNYVNEKFQAGLVNALAYATASNFKTAAEAELLQSKYEYLFKLKILDYYRGEPISLQ